MASPAMADMFQDGSNAAAQVRFPGSLSVNGGNLTTPAAVPFAVGATAGMGLGRFKYGAAGAPLPVDPAYGYSGVGIEVFGNPGTGTADPFTTALTSDSHLSAGSRGLAVGIVGRGYAEGSWTNGGAFEPGVVGVWAEGRSTRGGNTFALEATCHQSVTAGGGMTCVEVDAIAQTNLGHKYGLAFNASGSGAVTGTGTVLGGGTYLTGAAIVVQSIEAGSSFPNILLTIANTAGYQPVPVDGNLWRAGGFTVANGLAWPEMTFTGFAVDAGNNFIKGKLATQTGYTAAVPTVTGWLRVYDAAKNGYRMAVQYECAAGPAC
jgi:hypothetical protein